ncbi:uncharacterized protein TM35_000751170 [Trypanosoma theileri]|uniref:Uncharacterized protein n=1 Tax=Trypanosoma theileri TaxID=67003 RepID=A0A1X0NH01_9TRYP|nr:uncharacterized protein TM35_000751170 [Trypanosoma theileri]ORC83350.1 hypothetical protein TM35_000751170 [Trypanosoma theileri]
MLYNDVMHPINIAWLLYDVLNVAVFSFIPETFLRKRIKRSSRRGRRGTGEEDGEGGETDQEDQRSHRSHRSHHHRRSGGSSSQPPSVNTSLNASAFASGELPPQVPHRSRSHSGGLHARREKSTITTTTTTTNRWRDWRSIDITKQARVVAHILRATPVALLHFLCQYKTDVATLPLLQFSDLNNHARSLLWFSEDAVFASGVVVSFTITRVLLRAIQQYIKERLLFETNLVVRSLRSRRAWRNTFGWALTISAHTITDPIAFSTVACMLLARKGNVQEWRVLKYTPAGIIAAGAVGCAGVVLEIMFTPVAVQLCQCGVVRVFDAAEYLLLRRYATEALEYEEEEDDDDDDDDMDIDSVDNNNNNDNNNNDGSVVGEKDNDHGDVSEINRSRNNKNSHEDEDDEKKKKKRKQKEEEEEEGDKSKNNDNGIVGEEKKKEKRERRREKEHSRNTSHNSSREEIGGSNVNSEDENGTTERSHHSHKRHRSSSSEKKKESHHSSKSNPLTDDSENERATHNKESKKDHSHHATHNSSSIITSGRTREKSRAEKKKEREERRGKAKKAEERAIVRAIMYRVVASLIAQCMVQHPLTVLAHMLYNRAVLHGVGLLTVYDRFPNTPLTWHAWLQFLRFSDKNYNASGEEESSGVLIVEILRSMGYFIGHEVSMVSGSIRNCSSQDAGIRALVKKAEQKLKNDGNNNNITNSNSIDTDTNLGNRALAMESAELMLRSIASLSPLFTALHFTAIDKLLGFYMAVWVRLNDR